MNTPKPSRSGLIAQKTLGLVIIWGTVGLVSIQTLFYVAFGPAL
jgi:hypothetical protein